MSRVATNDAALQPAARGLRRPRCVVAVDLRDPQRLDAVAVDARGRVRAWGGARLDAPLLAESVSPDGPWDATADGPLADALARLTRDLRVRVDALRLLVGRRGSVAAVEVTSLEGAATPEAVERAFRGEGLEPMADAALSTLEGSPGHRLVARAPEGDLGALAEAVTRRLGVEPTVVPDASLLLGEPGAVDAELDGSRLRLVAHVPQADPLHRELAVFDAADAAREIVELRRAFALDVVCHGDSAHRAAVRCLGRDAEALRRSLDDASDEPITAPRGAPDEPPSPVPPRLDLALRLAVDPAPAAFESPLLAARRGADRWARRLAVAAAVLGVVGLLYTVSGLGAWLLGLPRQAELRRQQADVGAQIVTLQETAALAQDVAGLRRDDAARTPRGHRLATTLATLERDTPAGVGWRGLVVDDGRLELQVSATGAQGLEAFRRALGRVAGLGNPAWDPPERPAARGAALHQVVHATLTDPSLREAAP